MTTLQEDFLHFLWSAKKIPFKNLQTTEGLPIEILSWGIYNVNSGPDFKECAVKIGETTWAGQVEMHLNAKDWYLHQHQKDPAYNNVVLHVVWNHDSDVKINNYTLPVLELKGNVPLRWVRKYRALKDWKTSKLACQNELPSYNSFEWKMWLERIAIERLDEKKSKITKLNQHFNNDTEQTIQALCMKTFGLPTNKDPMLKLALHFPYSILSKYRMDEDKIWAITLGLSGWLEIDHDHKDWIRWQQEFAYLKKIHNLSIVVKRKEWILGRLRPSNFPTIRIVQCILLLKQVNNIVEKIKMNSIADWKNAMSAIEIPDYWKKYYIPGGKKSYRNKKVGKNFVNVFLINAVVPALLFLAEKEEKEVLKDKAITMLEEIQPEKNHITKKYEELDKKPENALESQAQIHLFNYYCRQKKCLNCTVGTSILNA